MQVVIKKGEAIKVGFLDTDGNITVTYGKKRLKVHADMPDSSGREKVIYEEIFDGPKALVKGDSAEPALDESPDQGAGLVPE
jgi:hypothetical protein